MVFCPELQIFGKTRRSQYMRLFKLLVRVAFICNVCFILASLILLLPNPPEGQVVSTVIVVGYILGLPANAIVFGWAIALGSSGRWREAEVPVWLMVVNAIVLSFQLLLLILQLVR
jgi:hypothetical protein